MILAYEYFFRTFHSLISSALFNLPTNSYFFHFTTCSSFPMSSFHPLVAFLKLQLKDIVHKLISLRTVPLQRSPLKQYAIGKGNLVRSRGGGMWDLVAEWGLDFYCSAMSQARGKLNPQTKQSEVEIRNLKPGELLGRQWGEFGKSASVKERQSWLSTFKEGMGPVVLYTIIDKPVHIVASRFPCITTYKCPYNFC